MVHYAEIDDNNIVLRVIVCDTREWCEQNLGGRWVRTYYNTPGHTFAGIGFIYYPDLDNFSPPKPYPSWILDTNTMQWNAPVPYPTDPIDPNSYYVWNEELQQWDLVVIPQPDPIPEAVMPTIIEEPTVVVEDPSIVVENPTVLIEDPTVPVV